jgi:hypothetical protein
VVKAGHSTDAGLLQRGDDALEVVGIDPHVAVSNNNDLMVDASPHVDKVGNLAVQPVLCHVDDEIKMTGSMFSPKVLDDRNRVIPWVLHAKDDLNGARIVLAQNEARFSSKPSSAPCSGLRIVTPGMDARRVDEALRAKRSIKSTAPTR